MDSSGPHPVSSMDSAGRGWRQILDEQMSAWTIPTHGSSVHDENDAGVALKAFAFSRETTGKRVGKTGKKDSLRGADKFESSGDWISPDPA